MDSGFTQKEHGTTLSKCLKKILKTLKINAIFKNDLSIKINLNPNLIQKSNKNLINTILLFVNYKSTLIRFTNPIESNYK